MAVTREQIAETVASWDMSDRMLWAQEGADSDQCWFLVQDIARYLGLTSEADSEYLSDKVCERWDNEYEEFCQPMTDEE